MGQPIAVELLGIYAEEAKTGRWVQWAHKTKREIKVTGTFYSERGTVERYANYTIPAGERVIVNSYPANADPSATCWCYAECYGGIISANISHNDLERCGWI